jgi:AcrR family transcriptional regulator
MADEKRQYRKQRRAELEQQTRLKITESTVELHGTLGPARTSISAVAELAGVRRSTVYRHFPDEAALFAACSTHWMTSHPPPDIGAWAAVEDPPERLRRALAELYAYYRENESMLANLHRDEDAVPVVGQLFAGFHAYMAAARDTLAQGRPRQLGARRVRAAIGHALAFSTWQSLAGNQGLSDREATDLMCRLVEAAGRPPGRSRQEAAR